MSDSIEFRHVLIGTQKRTQKIVIALAPTCPQDLVPFRMIPRGGIVVNVGNNRLVKTVCAGIIL